MSPEFSLPMVILGIRVRFQKDDGCLSIASVWAIKHNICGEARGGVRMVKKLSEQRVRLIVA
jgi:glutamate dehydrogenase/leucine dehydrogenase